MTSALGGIWNLVLMVGCVGEVLNVNSLGLFPAFGDPGRSLRLKGLEVQHHLSCHNHLLLQPINACSIIHLPFEHLQTIDESFHWTIVDPQGQTRSHSSIVVQKVFPLILTGLHLHHDKVHAAGSSCSRDAGLVTWTGQPARKACCLRIRARESVVYAVGSNLLGSRRL